MIRTFSLFVATASVLVCSACGGPPSQTSTTTSDVDTRTSAGGESHEVSRVSTQTDANGQVVRHTESTEQTTPPSQQH